MARVDIFLKKYYTDSHNVDEDMMSILLYGSDWRGGVGAGLFGQQMSDPSWVSYGDVASSDIRN